MELKSERLPNIFPALFVQDADVCIGNGWYNTVHDVCRQIARYIPSKDWEGAPPKILQIKEKFGGLRIYVSNSDRYISGLILDAENKASITCEFCGTSNPDDDIKARNNRWIKTLCAKCEAERG